MERVSNLDDTDYFNCEVGFNGIFSKDNLPSIKDKCMSLFSMTKKKRNTFTFAIYY